MDSVGLNLHDQEQLKNLSSQELQSILSNPQLLNSYAYSANNPVVYTDPDGNFLDTFLDIGFIAYDVYKIAQSYAQTGQVNQEYVKALSLDSVGLAIPGATGLGLMGRVVSHADDVVDVAKVIKKADTVNDASKYIDNVDDIIPLDRQNHILNGDMKGGGHKFGANKGKPEFPSSWSDKQIFHNATDIATDPSLNWSRQRDGRWFVSGIRDNVNMKVIIDPTKSHIITAFPKIK